LIESDSRSQTAEQFGHAMDAAGDHGGGEMVRAGYDVRNELGVSRVGNGRLEDADDGGGARIEANLLADNQRITVQRGGPEAIGEHRGACGFGPVVAHIEEAAEDGTQTHNLEIGAADNARANFAGITEPHHGEADGREVAKGADRFHVGAQVLDLGHGESGVFDADAGRALADVDEAIFLAVRKRAQQDAAHQSKDSGIGAYAERER
jgi:hypothetical protein